MISLGTAAPQSYDASSSPLTPQKSLCLWNHSPPFLSEALLCVSLSLFFLMKGSMRTSASTPVLHTVTACPPLLFAAMTEANTWVICSSSKVGSVSRAWHQHLWLASYRVIAWWRLEGQRALEREANALLLTNPVLQLPLARSVPPGQLISQRSHFTARLGKI